MCASPCLDRTCGRHNGTAGTEPSRLLTRRQILRAGSAASGVLALGRYRAASSPLARTSDEPRAGGSLVVAVPPDVFPESFDVAQVGPGISDWLQYQLYDRLLRVSADGTMVEPGIIERWEVSPDGLVYTLRVRQAAFHDGSPVTIGDVVVAIRRLLAVHPLGERLDGPIETPDDRTIVMRLMEPCLPLLVALSFAPVLPERLVEKQKLLFFENPIGSGPFRFSSWDPGIEVALTKNPNYWESGRPYLDEVRFLVIPDFEERIARLEEGIVDLVPSVGPDQVASFAGSASVAIVKDPPAEVFGLIINTGHPPLGDKALRQAINYAIDREEMVRVVFQGLAEPATTCFATHNPWHDAGTPGFPFDLDKAKALVATSAGKDGFAVELVVSKDDPFGGVWLGIAHLVAEQLARIGGQVSVVEVSLSEVFERVGTDRYDLLQAPQRWEGDPRWPAVATIASFGDGGLSRYPLAEFDGLLAEADATIDVARRMELYADIQRRANEEAFWAFLVHPYALAAMRSTVKGYRLRPGNRFRLWDVWRDDV